MEEEKKQQPSSSASCTIDGDDDLLMSKEEEEGSNGRLIDLSSENDNLIFNLSSPLSSLSLQDPPSTDNQEQHRILNLSDSVNTRDKMDMACNTYQKDELPELSQSVEPERSRRNAKLNLRKSLAWDSAFFTNAGVLDAEELSSMIEGAEKGGHNVLPGIEEDIRGSTDSISTFESDKLTIESLEADLFLDIRASIQRLSKVSDMENQSSKGASGEINIQSISSAKKTDSASKSRLNTKPPLRKTAGKQPTETSKGQQKQTGAHQLGKVVKRDAQQLQVGLSVTKIRESTSSCAKPPKVIARANPVPAVTTKRAASSGSRVKMENDSTKSSTVACKGIQASKVPVPSMARRVLPKPTASNSSSLGSSTAITIRSSRSSMSDTSRRTSSESTAKSPLVVTKRKVEGRVQVPPGSISKTPSKYVVKNKTPSSNSVLSAYLRSSKLSSSISPASSISEWSSASSSTSTVNQRSSKSRTSFDTVSCRSLDSDVPPLDLQAYSDAQITGENETQGKALPNANMKKCSTQVGALSRPSSVKPTGLRMPSPKIGFFDGVKSSVRTPNGALQLQSGLAKISPQNGAVISSPRGNSNGKPKCGKVPPVRTITASASVNPVDQTPASHETSQEKVHPLQHTSSIAEDEKDCPSLSLEVQDYMNERKCLKVNEVGDQKPDGAKDAAALGLEGITSDDLSAVKNKVNVNIQATAVLNLSKIVPVEGETFHMGSHSNEILSPSPKVTQDALASQDHLKDTSNLVCMIDENENDTIKHQANGVEGHVGDCKLNYLCHKYDSLSNISDPASFTKLSTTYENAASRTPLTAKNSFGNGEALDFSKESSVQVTEKIAVPLFSLEIDQKENI